MLRREVTSDRSAALPRRAGPIVMQGNKPMLPDNFGSNPLEALVDGVKETVEKTLAPAEMEAIEEAPIGVDTISANEFTFDQFLVLSEAFTQLREENDDDDVPQLSAEEILE